MDIKKNLIAHGVPEHLHEEALANFALAKERTKPLTKYKLLAPLVMFWLLYLTKKVKWEDNKLPEQYWQYDNNISMNGDGWGTLLKDGTCLNQVDKKIVEAGEGIAIPYFDERYTGDAYYAEGHHPRSKRARYVWMGWRNRASAFAQEQGLPMRLDQPLRRWGTENPQRLNPGSEFLNCDGLWQFREVREVFFKKLTYVRNLGFKINNTFGEQKPHAMVVWIPSSIKGGAKK